MTAKISRDDIALYVMGAYDGDTAALEARIADDAEARAMLAEEAELELSLRDAAASGTFCTNCDDLVVDLSEPVRCSSCGAAVSPGGYAIESVIVANAHGRMYVARDADKKRVALKELAFVQSPSSETVAAFEREAKFLRALEHPAIPRFVAAFEEGSGVHTRYYLAQELVDGTALDTRLDEHFYSEAEIIEIARQVLGVLVYLQSLSPMVIHRDIKPANLLRRSDGTIAVVDFGAAHVQGTTAGSTSIGTFGYMPLEQLAGQVDATTDTYALGASLIHLLTRREPWRVFGPATFESINVSPAVQQFLARCVAPEPKDRFANAAAALAGLDAPAITSPPRRPRLSRNSWRIGVGILAAALTLGGAGVAGYVLHDDPAPKATNTTTPRLTDPPPDTEAPKAPKPIVLQPRFTSTAPVSLEFKGAPIPVVLRTIARACNVNVVLSDGIQGPVTVSVKDVPCGQILEVILESNGLGYAYDPTTNFLRISSRREIEREIEEVARRSEVQSQLANFDDTLPPGGTVDFDFSNAPMSDLAKTLADVGKVNVVIPDGLQARVTIIATKTPWDATLKQVLAASGLWLRYRPEGRIVRIASRRELDREDEEQLARAIARNPDLASRPMTAPMPAPPRFTGVNMVSIFREESLPGFMRYMGQMCDVNVVTPSNLTTRIRVSVMNTPCKHLLETILESHGLDYAYDPKAKLMRVAPRNEILHEREEAMRRTAIRQQLPRATALPDGPLVQLDYKEVELRVVLEELASANKVNLVMPERLGGKVSILAKDVPWTSALEAVLASQGMGYRYRSIGRLLRIAPWNELDHEDEERLARPPVAPESKPPSVTGRAGIDMEAFEKLGKNPGSVVFSVQLGTTDGIDEDWSGTVLDDKGQPLQGGACEVIRVSFNGTECRVTFPPGGKLTFRAIPSPTMIRFSPP